MLFSSPYSFLFFYVLGIGAFLFFIVKKITFLLDTLPALLWLSTPGGKIIFYNKSAKNSFHHTQIVDISKRLGRRVKKTVLPQSESYYVTLKGQRKLYEVTQYPLNFFICPPIHVCYAQDVTLLEESQAKISMHVSTERSILEKLGIGVAIFSADRRLHFCNEPQRKLWSATHGVLPIGSSFKETIQYLNQNKRLAITAEHALSKEEQIFTDLFSAQTEILTLPNNKNLMQITMPYFEGGVLQIQEDITDRLQLEKSYQNLTKAHKDALSNLDEGVALFDQDKTLRLWNKPFQQIWRLEETFLDGSPHIDSILEQIEIFFNPEDHSKSDRRDKIVNILFNSHRIFKTHLNLKNGHTIAFTCIPLPTGTKLTLYNDITDSENIHKALEEKNRILKETADFKTQFIAYLSKELLSPLNGVLGFGALLTDSLAQPPLEENAEKSHDYLNNLHLSTIELQRKIQNIITLMSLESKQLDTDLHPVALISFLKNFIEKYQKIASEFSRLDGDFLLKETVCWLDESILQQILSNMLAVILGTAPHGNPIILRCALEKNHIALSLFYQNQPPAAKEEEARFLLSKLESKTLETLCHFHGGYIKPFKNKKLEKGLVCFLPLIQEESLDPFKKNTALHPSFL